VITLLTSEAVNEGSARKFVAGFVVIANFSKMAAMREERAMKPLLRSRSVFYVSIMIKE
jgi:hypothetical protein